MYKYNAKLLSVFTFLVLIGCYGQNNSPDLYEGNMRRLDHNAWDILLKKYVDDKGNVNYKKWQTEKKQLSKYLVYLTSNPIAKTADKDEILAFYINLYNAATVSLILENYPLKSIKNIFRPWGKKRVTIGQAEYSLGNIEHDILRKMNEPRIHFAINCASFSCPKLLNEAFTGSKMEEQLEKVTFDFVNDTSKNQISKNVVSLSKIFKWYKEDFTEKNSLIDYIDNYSDIEFSDDPEIKYLTYDWRLNEKR